MWTASRNGPRAPRARCPLATWHRFFGSRSGLGCGFIIGCLISAQVLGLEKRRPGSVRHGRQPRHEPGAAGRVCCRWQGPPEPRRVRHPIEIAKLVGHEAWTGEIRHDHLSWHVGPDAALDMRPAAMPRPGLPRSLQSIAGGTRLVSRTEGAEQLLRGDIELSLQPRDRLGGSRSSHGGSRWLFVRSLLVRIRRRVAAHRSRRRSLFRSTSAARDDFVARGLR